MCLLSFPVSHLLGCLLCYLILYIAMCFLTHDSSALYPLSKTSRHQPPLPCQIHPIPTHGHNDQRFQKRHLATIMGATPQTRPPSQTLQHSGRSPRRPATIPGTLGHLQRLHPLATSQVRHRRNPRPQTIEPRTRLLRPPDPHPRHPTHQSPLRHRPLCKNDLPPQPTARTHPSLRLEPLPARLPHQPASNQRLAAAPREREGQPGHGGELVRFRPRRRLQRGLQGAPVLRRRSEGRWLSLSSQGGVVRSGEASAGL